MAQTPPDSAEKDNQRLSYYQKQLWPQILLWDFARDFALAVDSAVSPSVKE